MGAGLRHGGGNKLGAGLREGGGAQDGRHGYVMGAGPWAGGGASAERRERGRGRGVGKGVGHGRWAGLQHGIGNRVWGGDLAGGRGHRRRAVLRHGGGNGAGGGASARGRSHRRGSGLLGLGGGGMVAMQGACPGGQKCCGGVACWAWLNVMGVWPIVGVAIANHAPFRCCTSRKQSLAPPPPGPAFSCALAPPPWTRWVLR